MLSLCTFQSNNNITKHIRTKEQDGFKVIFITDISSGGENPKQVVWTYDMLKSNMKEKKASLVRFNFLDIQVGAPLLLT